jgi:hypothetical protein
LYSEHFGGFRISESPLIYRMKEALINGAFLTGLSRRVYDDPMIHIFPVKLPLFKLCASLIK